MSKAKRMRIEFEQLIIFINSKIVEILLLITTPNKILENEKILVKKIKKLF
jgi:hypothetical protein